MPYKKRNRVRPRRRRKYHPYRRRRKALASMGTPSGMPTTRIAKMRYCTQVALSSTLGSLATHQFSASGIYDPDITGVGHQPMGFDQWAALFNHYVVIGSKISAYITHSSTSFGMVNLYLSDDASTPYTSTLEFTEAKKGTFTVISNQRTPAKLYSKYSAKKFFNITDVKDNLDRIGAPNNANPTDTAVYNLVYQTTDASTHALDAIVVIDYLVLWSEPKDISVS